MKFNKLSQLALISAIGLLVSTLLAGCYLITVDYLFVAASEGTAAGSPGEIYAYAIDGQSGAIRTVLPSVPTGGAQPVSMALTSDNANLYVANQGNNSVVHFAIAYRGQLTQKDSVTLPTKPVSVMVNASNTYLYVISGTNSATLTEYSLSNGAIGSVVATQQLTVPGYPSDTIIPTGINVLGAGYNSDTITSNGSGTALYVTAYDESAYNPGGSTTSNANPGWIFGFAVGTNGTLSPVASSPWQAGVKPSAVTSDPTGRFVYVTDFASNDLIGYGVLSTHVLNFLLNGPFKTGNEPTAITIDPRGIYMYVSNSLDNTVSAYTIALPTGTPSTVVNSTSSSGNVTDTDPVAIAVDPALGRFVYTANHLGNTVSGFELNPNTGAIDSTLATPYPTGVYPMAIVVVPHGNQATQSITP
ncbi:MAG: lactonase family protein [Terracidiphilus sp.]